jgi:hypothetical protein
VRTTRRQALAGGAALAASAALPSLARAADPDEERAEAALVAVLDVEQTAEVAYEAIANAGVLTDVLRAFLDHEHQHVEQMQAALDALGADAPIPPRRTEIPGLAAATRGRAAAARFAIGLEERAIAAYQRAIRDILDPNAMKTAAGAMGTDAQQLVVLRGIAGAPLVPHAFERGRR